MMVNPEPMARQACRAIGRRKQERIRSLGAAAQVLATIAGLAALYLAWTISGSPVQATVYTMLGLAGIIGVSTFATLWAQTALAEQLDILTLALNAAPDAQAILARNGGLAYANLAFDRLFPGRAKIIITDRGPNVRAVAPSVGSTFRQARLPVAPDTAVGVFATSQHAARRKR